MITKSLGKVGIANKGEFAMDKTYNQCDFVHHKGSTWLALKNNLVGIEPTEGANWKYLARGFEDELLNMITATDTLGLLGEAGQKINAQNLIDVIADKVATKLIEKGMISNNLVTDRSDMVLSAAMGMNLQKQIDQQNNNLNVSIFKKTENNQIVNADTAPFGVSIIAPNMVNNPFNFWCTLITTGQEWYTQQLALPWSYADKSLKYRVKDSGVWSEWIEFIPNPDIKYFKELKLIRDGKFINTTPAFTYHGYVNGWDEQMDKSMLPTLEGTWWDIQYFPSIYEDNDQILSDSQAKMIAINSNGDLYIRTHQQNGWGNWKLK